MPVTPFHFGFGLLFKGAGPRHVSLSAFVASQVLLDLESGYHLWHGNWPVHRVMHTFPVATLAGLFAGACVALAGRWIRLGPETALRPALVGGLLGGVSHPILDGIMHADMHPFAPFSPANPLLDLVGLGALHLGCVIAGALGALFRWARQRASN